MNYNEILEFENVELISVLNLDENRTSCFSRMY